MTNQMLNSIISRGNPVSLPRKLIIVTILLNINLNIIIKV
jgi:hypothetical protein